MASGRRAGQRAIKISANCQSDSRLKLVQAPALQKYSDLEPSGQFLFDESVF